MVCFEEYIIFVVDDNFVNRSILEECLLYWGVKLIFVGSGSVVLVILCNINESDLIEVVIIDYYMFLMDGLMFVEKIREDSKYGVLFIIVFLFFNDNEVIKKFN